VSASIVDWNFKNFVRRDAHDNNSGWLHVLVEELPNIDVSICAIDSSSFPSIRLSLKVTRDGLPDEGYLDDVVIVENGLPARIDSVDCGERSSAVSVAMVFDRSGSMQEPFGSSTRITETIRAGKRFVDRLAEFDEAAVFSFSTTTTRDQDWTTNKGLLKTAIDRLWPNGWTAMNDAIVSAIDDVQLRSSGRRKAVVVLSDGEDNRSRVTAISEVADRARRAGVRVFTIGLLLDQDDSLKLLAQQTGGRYFSIRDAAAMDSVFASVADLVLEKGCCSVYYTTPDPRRNGTFRPVTVLVNYDDDTVVAGYTGYHAPGGTSAVEGASVSVAEDAVRIAPNPIQHDARIRLRLDGPTAVSIEMLDVVGRRVHYMPAAELSSGEHEFAIPVPDLENGQYFMRITMGGHVVVRPVVIAR
jgi:VWFA-related protein